MNTMLSIITVTYNCDESIETTLKSLILAKDKYPSCIELILVDGGSKVTSLNILKKYSNKFDFFLSEPDTGIYNAMNKGISNSKAKWVYFLNDGDEIINIDYIITKLKEFDNSSIYCLSFAVALSNGKTFYPKISYLSKLTNTLHHQGSIYRKTSALYYNEEYKIFSDFNYNINMINNKYKIKCFNTIVAKHSLAGASNHRNNQRELFKVIYNNGGYINVIFAFIYFKLRAIYAKF